MVELENVSKSFARAKAVDGISFEVAESERLVILGPSGSGKTTILRLIAGFELPQEGNIYLGGKRVSSPEKIDIPPNKRGVGMVFQDLVLWPHLNIKGNIAFALGGRGFASRDIDDRVKDILNIVGLHEDIRKYPSQLSGGQQQRLALARTLVNQPRILLLDEPLANLDPLLKEELTRVLLDIQARLRITLIYVTHSQAEALNIAQRLIILKQGVIEQIGTPEEIISSPRSDFVRLFLRRREDCG